MPTTSTKTITIAPPLAPEMDVSMIWELEGYGHGSVTAGGRAASNGPAEERGLRQLRRASSDGDACRFDKDGTRWKQEDIPGDPLHKKSLPAVWLVDDSVLKTGSDPSPSRSDGPREFSEP
jgi:hypothetical protein